MADLKEIVEQMEANYPEGSALTMILAELLIEEGEAKALAKTVVKLLIKKFEIVPEEMKEKIF